MGRNYRVGDEVYFGSLYCTVTDVFTVNGRQRCQVERLGKWALAWASALYPYAESRQARIPGCAPKRRQR